MRCPYFLFPLHRSKQIQGYANKQKVSVSHPPSYDTHCTSCLLAFLSYCLLVFLTGACERVHPPPPLSSVHSSPSVEMSLFALKRFALSILSTWAVIPNDVRGAQRKALAPINEPRTDCRRLCDLLLFYTNGPTDSEPHRPKYCPWLSMQLLDN